MSGPLPRVIAVGPLTLMFRHVVEPSAVNLPAPLCRQGRDLGAFEGAPALVAVKVVRPVGRSTLTAPARRRGGCGAEAAWGFAVGWLRGSVVDAGPGSG